MRGGQAGSGVSLPLSSIQVQKLAGSGSKVLLYSDLLEHSTLESVFGNASKIALLYRQTPSFGHWIAIYKSPGGMVSFMDPYGKFIDSEIKRAAIPSLGQGDPVLIRLMLDYMDRGNKVEYNEKPLQKVGDDINTCGRFVGYYLQKAGKGMTMEEFQREFAKNGDAKIVKATNGLF